LGQVTISGNEKIKLKPAKMLGIDTAEYKFTYDVQFVKDTLNRDRLVSGRTLLLVGKHSSVYVDYYAALSDSIYAESVRDGMSIMDAMNKSSNVKGKKFRETVVMNYPNQGEALVQDYFGGAFRRYIDKTCGQTWSLTDETMEILGYECRKAKCDFRGRSYVAWYTDEIPVHYGPFLFGGLPGLIVRLESDDKEYQFNLIGIDKVRTPFLVEIYDGRGVEVLSRDDFRYLKQYYNENAAAGLLNNSSGVKLELTPEQEKELEKRLNRPRPYNPIEKE
jgi:GLPGLI family protein